jgi:flagellar hook assembly protein FlgD
MRLTVSGQISFGWLVQPFVNGIAGAPVRKGSAIGKHVAFTWDGKDSRNAIVRDGTYRITIWTADASNNQASATRLVTVDRRPAAVALTASSSFISPDADGHWDRTTLAMHGDEAISGTVRLIDQRHAIVRLWAISAATAGSWIWDGRDRAGRIVADGRYLAQVIGLDRAGNRTVRQLPLTVDRTIRSLTWLKPSFVPRVGQTDHATLRLARPARVTVAIYQGSTLVRTIWTNRPFAAGAYGWTWNGRNAAGALVRPGLYTALIAATSSIGTSQATRVVTVRVR